jgi:protein CpxP
MRFLRRAVRYNQVHFVLRRKILAPAFVVSGSSTEEKNDMKKNNWITAAAVLALSTSLAVAAPKGGGHGGKHGRHGKGNFAAKMAEKLNLTDAQKQQIETLDRNFREQNKAAFEANHETMRQFRDARKANDTAKLESLKPAMEAQRAEMKRLHEAQMQQILSVLTPEQRQQWEALKAERGKHGKHRN